MTHTDSQVQTAISTLDYHHEDADLWNELHEKSILLEESHSDVKDANDRLREQKIQLDELRLRMQSTSGGSSNSCVGTSDRQPVPNMASGLPAFGDTLQKADLRSLLTWLSTRIDVDGPSVWIQQSGSLEFVLGDESCLARLGRTQQFAFHDGSNLRISIPEEVVTEVVALIRQARQTGDLDANSLGSFAHDWEIVAGQSIPDDQPNPLYVLNTTKRLVVIIATWPTPYFDPHVYFSSLTEQGIPPESAAEAPEKFLAETIVNEMESLRGQLSSALRVIDLLTLQVENAHDIADRALAAHETTRKLMALYRQEPCQSCRQVTDATSTRCSTSPVPHDAQSRVSLGYSSMERSLPNETGTRISLPHYGEFASTRDEFLVHRDQNETHGSEFPPPFSSRRRHTLC